MKKIEIMDTTVRDGEQTKAVSFKCEEKLVIVKRLLADVGVNRCEVSSARVSAEEQKALAMIMDWAKETNFENQVEVLSFTDYKKSIDWLLPTGCRRINLLTKGSQKHCELQLGKSLSQHLADVRKTVDYAKENGFKCNVYLEDWSNGIKNSPDYVWQMLDTYQTLGFERILLPDTLGILNPFEVYDYISQTVARFPELKFEFHAHNDYGMAVANTLAAVDHTEFSTSINEKKLKDISVLVETFSGKRIASNMPILGGDVFTQTAGIHADGDKKGNLYVSRLTPDRFDRNRTYALGKLSGKASLEMNLNKLRINLNNEQKEKLLQKIVELGDLKKNVTVEDLPFLVSDMLGGQRYKNFRVKNCVVTTTMQMKPCANVQVEYKGKIYEETSQGSGGYDAFMNALRKLSPKMGLEIPKLMDFEITIPPGGNSNSLVEAVIKWDNGLVTHAVSSDQVKAAIKATERILNLIEQ